LPDKLAEAIADQRLIVTDITAFVGHPTMSFRTVAPNACPHAPMVKLSVALQLTSIQRTLPPRAACMAPRISRMLRSILEQEAMLSRIMTIIPARYGLHMTMEPVDDNLCQQAAVLYRDNPMSLLRPGEMAIPVGSLFALDVDNQPLLRQWMRLIEGGDTKANTLAFFQRYLAIAVPALLGLYLLYGIALEAHQQNSFIVMGKDGQPERLLIQDFDGIDIDRAALEERGFTVQQFGDYPAPFKASDDVRVQLLHASFMCHIGELALLCAREWDMPDHLFWDAFHTAVVQCFDTVRPRMAASRWSTERHAILEADWPARSLLRMKLSESPREIICLLSNPLRGAPTLEASLREMSQADESGDHQARSVRQF
jgi:siderophore synthetase component